MRGAKHEDESLNDFVVRVREEETRWMRARKAHEEIVKRRVPQRPREEAVSRRAGRPIDLVKQKPYTSVHNGGYTECQEFYGAIPLKSEAPLGRQIVNMLDVALRGGGNYWDDLVIPGLEYVVIENTLGKVGPKVECFSRLPANAQSLVGPPA